MRPRVALEIKTAEELVDPELEARWAARRAERLDAVFQCILRRFVEREGAIPIDEIVAWFPDRPRDGLLEEVAGLDERDLILVREGRVELAYPFAAVPTAFAVVLPGGRRRYACCAIDALGVAAMLGQRMEIRSRCHHCGGPLEFEADAEGPGPGADGVMVWVGKRGEIDRKVFTSL